MRNTPASFLRGLGPERPSHQCQLAAPRGGAPAHPHLLECLSRSKQPQRIGDIFRGVGGRWMCETGTSTKGRFLNGGIFALGENIGLTAPENSISKAKVAAAQTSCPAQEPQV